MPKLLLSASIIALSFFVTTFAPTVAAAETVTLDCGTVFVIDTTNNTVQLAEQGNRIDLTNVTLSDSSLSFAKDVPNVYRELG